MSHDISQYRPLKGFEAERSVIFPSSESLRWFVRMNREELVEAGALMRPSGRWLVSPDLIDGVVTS